MTLLTRASAAVIALLCASVAHAAYDEVQDTVVTLKRGSNNVTTAVLTGACAKIPGCSMPLTAANCQVIKARLIADEGATRETGASVYQCAVAYRSIVTFKANSTCPPLPPPEGRVVDCPAGFTGAYTQTLSYSPAPYPTCAAPGEWLPATPPASCVPIDTDNDGVPDQADECPTVHAQTPNGCPASPPAEWTFCANEWQLCAFEGTRRVRYGAGSTWVERDVTAAGGGVQCRNSVFGDPSPGTVKRCELHNSGGTDPQPPPAGTASLSWTPPTQNTDGTALTNLVGYRISYGTSPTALTQTIQLANAGLSSYTIGNLAPGMHYFTVRAYTSGGTESANSNVISKIVQ